jgi:hypothetical protein
LPGWTNPSYPKRTHFGEKTQIQERLAFWDDQLATVSEALQRPESGTDQGARERLFHQMHGARDQMAEALRRLPLEMGVLYQEDKERFHAAESALGRLLERWRALEPRAGAAGAPADRSV